MSLTVLLVHGAFADGSSWGPVLRHLIDAGVTARAVVNPLRGLSADGEYVKSQVAQTEGDVLLVGHSYGGPVITYAGSGSANVKGLVFVASFGLEQGVSIQDSTKDFPVSELNQSLQPWTFPGSDLPEFTIQLDKYHSSFGADLSDEDAAIGALNQRPVAAIAFGEPLAVEPAWKSVPSWWALSAADNAINPDYQRHVAEILGATVTELEGGSHSIAISRSREVADVILAAVKAVS